MEGWIKKLKAVNRGDLLFSVFTLVFSILIIMFLRQYFYFYGKPYMMKEIVNLSEGWRYKTSQSDTGEINKRSTDVLTLGTLHGSLNLSGGETLILYKTLYVDMPDAAILIRANHQTVNVYLDEVLLYKDRIIPSGENPGMALHFIQLPEDCKYKTLKIEITSPYDLYSGRTSPVLMGTIPSLEAYALSHSMRPVVIMAMCLLIGFCTIALTFIESLHGVIRPQNFFIGTFALIWALYYVCTEYIVFQFFTPILMSVLSLGLYFSFQFPLSLFFYFSFEHYRKWMMPAVILHCGFPAIALLLQFTGALDLPRLLNINNILLTGLIYTIVLAVLEACKMNRMMMLAAPFLSVAYVSMLYNFSVFYWRRGVVPYSYRDTYFLLVLFVMLYNVQQLFNQYYRKIRESELLTLQNRTAIENYEQIKAHLNQVGSLRHEMKNHLGAMQTFIKNGRWNEAAAYLERYAAQTEPVIDAVYHDNLLINTVVSKLVYMAKEQDIQVELDLRTEPRGIADPDLFSLLANVSDNALEACLSMPGSENRFIRLTISRREPYLNIICENSRAGEIIQLDGQLHTTKQDSGHGYGLETIKRITNDYAGIMDTDYNENTFTIMIALKDQ